MTTATGPARLTLGEDAHAGDTLVVDLSNGLLRRERPDDAPPPADQLGDHSLDLPFEANAEPTAAVLDNPILVGGHALIAAVIPVDGLGPMPALVFRFAKPDGAFLRPIVLVLDDDQARKFRGLAGEASRAAIDAARRARGRA